jgi:hypothetical protein
MMGNFRLSFGRAVKSLCVLDAAFLLVLTMGFVVPPKTLQDSRTGAIPRELYDDSAKMSPLAPPAPEPAHVKTTVPVITARGAHPTFVPASPEATADISLASLTSHE